MRKVTALVCLIAFCAQAQVVNRPARLQARGLARMQGPVASGPMFEFVSAPFVGQACPTLTGTKGEAITFTRSGTESCVNADGTIARTAANNCPCVTDLGYQTFPAVTNIATYSVQFNQNWNGTSGWQKDNTTILATNTNEVADPRGGSGAEKIRFNAGGFGSTESRVAQGPTSGQTNGAQYTTCMYGRCVTGTCTLYAWISDDTASTPCAMNSTGWTRCQRTGAANGTGTKWYNFGVPNWQSGVTIPQTDVYLYQADYVAGVGCPPPIETTTAAVTVNASYATANGVTMPYQGAIVTADYRRGWTTQQTDSGGAIIAASYQPSGGLGGWFVGLIGSGSLIVDGWNGSAHSIWNLNSAPWPGGYGTLTTLVFDWTLAGALVSRNGTHVNSSTRQWSNGGNGVILASPTKLDIGHRNDALSAQGWISRIAVDDQ